MANRKEWAEILEMTEQLQTAAVTRGYGTPKDNLVIAIDHLARVVRVLVGRELGKGQEVADSAGYVSRKLGIALDAMRDREGKRQDSV